MIDDALRLTFPEHWPTDLARLAGPSRSIPLEADELAAIAAQDPMVRTVMQVDRRPQVPIALSRRLAQLLTNELRPGFARLSTCSFKQGAWFPPPIVSVEQLCRRLRNPGHRAASMAWRCWQSEQPIRLHLRPWYHFEISEEFRLFFRGRRLVGASQYHHRVALDLDTAQVTSLAKRISAFAHQIADTLHTDDVVADVVMRCGPGQEPLLIELNPAQPATDAALFNWGRPGDFDATLRLRDRHWVVITSLCRTLQI